MFAGGVLHRQCVSPGQQRKPSCNCRRVTLRSMLCPARFKHLCLNSAMRHSMPSSARAPMSLQAQLNQAVSTAIKTT